MKADVGIQWATSSSVESEDPTANPLYDLIGDQAGHLLQIRRKRDLLLGAQYFADPAWDMLLHLFAAQQGGREVNAKCLALSSQAPNATARRWIDVLLHAGLIRERRDAHDRRRVLFDLSPNTTTAMRLALKVSSAWR